MPIISGSVVLSLLAGLAAYRAMDRYIPTRAGVLEEKKLKLAKRQDESQTIARSVLANRERAAKQIESAGGGMSIDSEAIGSLLRAIQGGSGFGGEDEGEEMSLTDSPLRANSESRPAHGLNSDADIEGVLSALASLTEHGSGGTETRGLLSQLADLRGRRA